MIPSSKISLVITSCGRHDLLKQTLESFISCTDIFPKTTIIVEDGLTHRPEWLDYPQLGNIIWLQNGARMGQAYSIDRAYNTVDTEYIFHCEDDWLFLKAGPFMRESLEILEKYPEVILVTLRNKEKWRVKDDRYPFLINRPSMAGMSKVFDGLTFNPGLRRLSDYRKLGKSFLELAHGENAENVSSAIYREMGYSMADLGTTYIDHLGDGRRILDPALKPKGDPMFEYTVALTSCNRHDMLKRTLDSFVECIDIFPKRTVIVEDSDASRPDWLTYPQLGEIVWVSNGKRRGQGYAIDQAYAEVQTEYLLHMEDDWMFVRKGPFIAESRAILEKYPEVLTVMAICNPPWTAKDPQYPFLLYKPSAGGLNPLYDGIAFAVGLRRLSDYKRFGRPFADFEKGLDINKMECAVVELHAGPIFNSMGYIMATLGLEYVGHIGDKSPYLHGRKA